MRAGQHPERSGLFGDAEDPYRTTLLVRVTSEDVLHGGKRNPYCDCLSFFSLPEHGDYMLELRLLVPAGWHIRPKHQYTAFDLGVRQYLRCFDRD
jgi:hypothetical protein